MVRARGSALLIAGLAVGAVGCAHTAARHGPLATSLGSRTSQSPPPRRAAIADRIVRRRLVLGRSVRGRVITVSELGDGDAHLRLLVVGCVHGDEAAGVAVARRLEAGAAPAEAALWVIDDLNPDGAVARTRQNAHLVDLNRNFPYRWAPLGRPGDSQYSGPRPLSEPEARVAHRLLLRLRPQVAIWFHQPLALVDRSGGSVALERRFARLAGLPLRRLPRYPGSAVGWQDHRLRGTTAFVVELPPGELAPAQASRYAGAVLALANRRGRRAREPYD
jgi:murein peptide amidase A